MTGARMTACWGTTSSVLRGAALLALVVGAGVHFRAVCVEDPEALVASARKARTHSVAGRLVTSEGRPGAGAEVVLFGPNEEKKGGFVEYERVVGRATADAEGRFQIDRLSSEKVLLTASLPAFYFSKEVTPEYLQEPLDVCLMRPARDLSGVVVNERGNPVRGARVHVSWYELIARTGRDGRFSLRTNCAPPFEVMALAEGRHGEVRVSGEEPQELRIQVPGNTAVSGTVTCDGAPVAGIPVKPSPNFMEPVKTDRKGFFALQGLMPGHTWLSIKEGPFYVISGERMILGEDERVMGHEIVVARGGTVRGVCLDEETRKPVAGVELSLRGTPARNGPPTVGESPDYSRESVTDRRGRFTFDGVPPGASVLSVAGDYEQGGRFSFLFGREEEKTVEFLRKTREKGVPVTFEVRDEQGRPISGVHVGTPDFRAEECAPGRYLMPNVPPGKDSMRLDVQRRGFSFQGPEMFSVTSLTDRPTVKLTMRREPPVTGRVVSEEGEGLPGVLVRPGPEGTLHQLVDGVTDHDGNFSLEVYGEHRFFQIDHEGFCPYTPKEHEVAGSPSVIVLRRRAPVSPKVLRTLRGQVVDDRGSPVAGASLYVEDAKAERNGEVVDAPHEVVGDADGRFRVEVLAGEHTGIGADFEGMYFREQARGQYVKPEENDCTVKLERFAHVCGSVVDKETDLPLPMIFVSLESDFIEYRLPWEDSAHFLDGQFCMDVLGMDEFEMSVGAEGYVTQHLDGPSLSPGERHSFGKIALERAGSVEGTIVDDKTGLPVAGAVLRDVDWELQVGGEVCSWGAERATSDERGVFRLQVWAGTGMHGYVLHKDYAPLEVSLDIPPAVTSRPVIRLTTGGTVRGLLTANGAPLSGHTVILTSLTRSPQEITVTTGAYGAFVIPCVEPGDFELRAENPDGKTVARINIIDNPVEEGGVREVRMDTSQRCCTENCQMHSVRAVPKGELRFEPPEQAP